MFQIWTEFTVSLGLILLALGWTATRDVDRKPRVGAPTSGLWPLLMAVLAGAWLPFPLPDSKFEWLFRLAVLFAAQAALTRWLFSEERVRASWKKLGIYDIGEDHDRAILRTSAFLALTFAVGFRHGLTGVVWVVAVLFLAALFVDVRRELRFRREHGFYAEVVTTRDLALAEAVAVRLSEHEIPVMIRAVSVARLMRLPWREVDVLVPSSSMNAVEDALLGTQVEPLWADRLGPDEVEE